MRASRHARPAPLATFALISLLSAGCWRTGEPTPSAGLVTWAAFPDTVRVGATFLFEFAGPITPTACGRLDTATVVVAGGTITLTARRSTFNAVCANQRISFYEARPLTIENAGTFVVRTADGRDLGTLVATDSGPFSRIGTRGEGTVREVAGCVFFGPGWIGGQRLFALSGAPAEILDVAGADRVVYVRGRLRGFSSCGSWGSRPRIRVDTAWVTDREAADWYRSPDP
ncbi:MAG: hypothetical protein ACC682_03920 [Gemmatimonadota bacterium]